MTTFDFTLTYALPDPEGDPTVHLDALYEAGCNDALIGVGRPGAIALIFTREAPSEQEAIDSARADVERAIPQCRLLHVERNDDHQP